MGRATLWPSANGIGMTTRTFPAPMIGTTTLFDKFQNYSELMAKRHKKRKIEDKRMTEIRPPFLEKPQK
jgi:hypothetical protein